MSTNGNLTAAERVTIPGLPAQALRADAADSWGRVRAALGARANLTDSYRPLSVQRKIFLERYEPRASGAGPYGDVRHYAGTRYVRMRGAAAAVPGTSDHGLGLAVDVFALTSFTSEHYRALAKVAHIHGWNNDAGVKINEPWHWEYTPANDTHPTERKPDVAHLIKGDKAPATYVLDPATGLRRYIDGLEFDVYTKQGSTVTTIPQAQLDALPKVPGTR
ncbi:M15 family metallopeptidase [Oerskovia sp. NPDC060338]|uniref:M15 family metallopeptidase n=1 Tax=Oerskovia sp. NPDC060338 TaxID=3347100 RepID=UPI00366135B0